MMLNKLDFSAIYIAKDLLTLRDYKSDGVLSYCDTSKLELLITLTNLLIDNTKIALENKNTKVLYQYSKYENSQLIDMASADFYSKRIIFSRCFYFLTQLNKQHVHHTEDISLIPSVLETYYKNDKNFIWPNNKPTIIIDDLNEETIPLLRDKFDTNNDDADMYLDRLINVFYH